MTKIMKRLRGFKRRSEGATVVELGMVALPFLVFILGVVEFSMITLATAVLEGGLHEASRYGITGSLPAESTSREEHVVKVINQHGAGMVDITQANLTVKAYPNFSKIGEPEPLTENPPANGQWEPGESYTDINCNGQWDEDMGKSGPGAGGEVVVYQVDYDFQLLVGDFWVMKVGRDGKFGLSANIAVRNEPFEGGDSLCEDVLS